jgi:hypothetical protein
MNTPTEVYVRATVNYYGMIPFLGVSGPITRPYRMKKSIYERLLANGYKVKLVENVPVPVKEEKVAAQPEPEDVTDVTVDEEVEAEVPTADDTDNEQTASAEEDAEIEEDVEEEPSGDDDVAEDDSEDATAEDEEVLEDSDSDEEPADEDNADAEYYSEEDLEGLTKAELKAILKSRGITVNKNLTVDSLKNKVLKSNPEM